MQLFFAICFKVFAKFKIFKAILLILLRLSWDVKFNLDFFTPKYINIF